MSSPKRHHFIPKFYLERFCSGALICVYDREKNEFRRQAPLNTAVMKDYYTILEEDGSKNTEVEQALALLESETKPVIEKLERREDLSEDERQALALFLAFLDTRVPEFERGFRELTQAVGQRVLQIALGTPERARKIMDALEKETGTRAPLEPEDLVTFVERGGYTIEPTRTASLVTAVMLAVQIAPLLLALDWVILHAPQKKSFIASDNPFTLLAPARNKQVTFYGVGLLTPDSIKFTPLGARIGIVLGNPGSQVVHTDAREAGMRELNLALTRRAERFVFARDERLLRNVVASTRLFNRPLLPRVQMD